MRIAEIAPAGVHPYSGVTTVIVELSLALADRGHHVELRLLSAWASADFDFQRDRLSAAGVAMTAARNAPAADIVHLHNTFSPKNNRLASNSKSPYVVTTHGGYAPEQLAHHAWRKQIFRLARERPMLRRAATVVAQTEAERAEVRAFGGIEAEIIPNGVAIPPADVDTTRFRSELGIGEHPLAIYVGRLDRFHKRLDEAVLAVAKAPQWHLALIGPDWRGDRARIVQLARDIGVEDRVHVIAARRGHRLDEAYAAADLFVLISRWEGHPISLLEAMAHGVPAVVSLEVDYRLGVADARAGVAVPPDRVHELLVASSAGETRSSLGAGAKAYAGRYDWKTAAEHYEALFLRIVTQDQSA